MIKVASLQGLECNFATLQNTFVGLKFFSCYQCQNVSFLLHQSFSSSHNVLKSICVNSDQV